MMDWTFETRHLDVCAVKVFVPLESKRRRHPMRTRYQYGNLQLDTRKSGPDVWVYRWREYGPAGKVNRHGELVGNVEQYPTSADALRTCDHLRLTANSHDPASRELTFGSLLDRYLTDEMPERHSTNLAYRSYI